MVVQSKELQSCNFLVRYLVDFDSRTCKMSSQRVEDSSDLDSDYEHAGAADYFELHEPFKDTV